MRSGSNARSTTTRLTSDAAVSLPSAPLPNSTTETRSSPQSSFNSVTKSDNTVSTLSGTPSSPTTVLSAITSPRDNPAARVGASFVDSHHRAGLTIEPADTRTGGANDADLSAVLLSVDRYFAALTARAFWAMRAASARAASFFCGSPSGWI